MYTFKEINESIIHFVSAIVKISGYQISRCTISDKTEDSQKRWIDKVGGDQSISDKKRCLRQKEWIEKNDGDQIY